MHIRLRFWLCARVNCGEWGRISLIYSEIEKKRESRRVDIGRRDIEGSPNQTQIMN